MSEIINNSEQKIATLKSIIKRLHAGEDQEQVKASLRQLVRETDHTEIVAMEQQLIAEGMPVQELTSMCDLHSQAMREVLVQLAPPPLPAGHPAETFRRENQALSEAIARARRAMDDLEAVADEADPGEALTRWRQAVNDLMDIDKHYQRKEHVIFSMLERHGINGPSKVMWAKDDQIRDVLKQLAASLREQHATAGEWKHLAGSVGEIALRLIEEMIYKEENILIPMCLNRFTADQWGEIFLASPRYGWCLVEPRTGYQPPDSVVKQAVRLGGGDAVSLPTGNLTLQQLTALFSTLPVDITFVDADDRVAFFSEGPDRTFARSKAIIGRKVQHCHPPKSVHIVDQIIDDFRSKRQSVAEFWINFQGKFIHIRYFAVRSEQGEYLGTLEVTQDLTHVRSLEGERRLLQYA